MVIFDIGLSFGLGCALKKVGRKETLGLSAIAAGLGVAPAGLVFLNVYPDWDLQYLVPKESLPLWFPGLFCFLLVGAGLLGNTLQSRWTKTLPVFAVLYGGYLLWSVTRIATVTSYADFHAGIESEFPLSFLLHLAAVSPITLGVITLCFISAHKVPLVKAEQQ